MLSFFPYPYPDELLYSVIARYHIQSGNLSMADTMWELFERRRNPISTVLQVRLGILAEKVKMFHSNFDQLLFRGTMYPFYMSVKSEENWIKVYRWAKESGTGAVAYELGILDYLPRKRKLCFCPLCYQEEREKYCEGYWHRLHQTPGVLICEIHFCRLQSSNLSAFSADLKGYYPLSEKQVVLTERLPELVGRELILAKQMIQDILYLYNNFLNIHFQFVKHNCTFRMEFLSLLIENDYATQSGSIRKIKFLESFEQFFTHLYLDRIGIPVIGEYKQWNIKMCRTGEKTKDPLKYILKAQFLCGSLEKFMQEMENPTRMMKFESQKRRPVRDIEKKREYYREHFEILFAQNENVTRTSIRKMDEATYLWLIRQDKDWLESHFEKSEDRGGNKKYAEWSSRDEKYSKQIPSIAQKIIKRKGKPERVTINKISKELQLGDLFYNHKKDLPLSMLALSFVLESKHEWYMRKIAWAEKEILKEEGKIVKWSVLRKAGISNKSEAYYMYLNSTRENDIESCEVNECTNL